MLRATKYKPLKIHSVRNIFPVMAAFLLVCLFSGPGLAAPLGYTPFGSIRFEGCFSRMMGRMAFGVTQTGQSGSLTDFRTDLGLPGDNQTWKLTASVRPMEHHLLRVYGSTPERYGASTIIQRDIVTRNAIYTEGTSISSELHTAQFGFGYDLDFILGPTWFGGLNADLRYLHLKSSISSSETGLGDTISVSEAMPCLGAHMETILPIGFGPIGFAGGARMTYGINPDFANYINISIGLSADFRFASRFLMDMRIGYRFESFNWSQTIDTGRAMEMERDGICFSISGEF